eukprot:CAMPEP_0117470478 /NCGR_PEP_ID=MMETSP0784-20121206/7236_1 /TAXON_ID=39447 /ORGANISM="" /LENGTH=1045 /DNA_ID=CAMNT_0005264567 /DNA_START=66 /DNA_END=3204 /DNA_ORIENTATION=-
MLSAGPSLPVSGLLGGPVRHISRGSSSRAISPQPSSALPFSPTLLASGLAPSAPAAVVAGFAGTYAPLKCGTGSSAAVPPLPFSAQAASSPAAFAAGSRKVVAAGLTTPASAQTAPAKPAVSAARAYEVPLVSQHCHSGPLLPTAPAGAGPSAERASCSSRSPRRGAERQGGEQRGLDGERSLGLFFYPTTNSPLTSYGINAIEQTVPPAGSKAMSGGADARQTGDEQALPPFTAAPLSTFVDSPEENQRLQEQNDTLARQVQALEHAKSLAAVQTAQQLRKIRARQEQVKREEQLKLQRARELQADFGFTPFQSAPLWDEPRDSSGLGSGRLSNLCATSPADSVRQCSRQPSVKRQSRQGSYQGSLPPPDLAPTVQVLERSTTETLPPPPLTDAEPALASYIPEPAQTIDPKQVYRQTVDHSQLQRRPALDEATRHPGRHGVSDTGGGLPEKPIWNEDVWRPARVMDDRGEGVGAMPAVTTPAYELASLPTVDNAGVQSVGGLASHAFGGHWSSMAGGVAPALVSMAAGQQPYVDAMGNPLGPTRGPELPNIKDYPPRVNGLDKYAPGLVPELPLGGPASSWVTPPKGPEGAGNQQPDAAIDPSVERFPPFSFSAHGPNAHAGHERAAGSNPAQGGGVASASRPSADGNVAELRGADSAAADDAEAGAAAPAQETSACTASADGPAGPGSAALADKPARPTDPASTVKGSGQTASHGPPQSQANPSPEQSEQLQAELEECLDMISWCGESVTRESLADLRNTTRPAPIVKDVLEAVSMLIGQPETKWDKLKRVLGMPTFLEKLQRLNIQQITREQFKKLRERLQHQDFDEELIKTVCVAVVPLAMWCRAIGVYLSKTKFKGGPDIRPVAAAGAASPPPQPRGAGAPPVRPSTPGALMIFDPDIDRLSLEELKRVKDLTISRPAVGSITFHGETDCTELDFEHVVRLEIGEVLIYPESSTKPPVGTGLNKAATVTMYQCWPPNPSKLLQDTKSQDRYKKKIKQMTEEKNATFIDYDCAKACGSSASSTSDTPQVATVPKALARYK